MILRDVISSEVQPAFGCTEPSAVAYACSVAMQSVKKNGSADNIVIKKITIKVDPGIMKNGMGVTIPNTGGQTGIPIAAILGALCGDPDQKLNLLSSVKPSDLETVIGLKNQHILHLTYDLEWVDFCIEAEVETNHGTGRVVIMDGHTNVKCVWFDDRIVSGSDQFVRGISTKAKTFRDELKMLNLSEIIELARAVDEDIRKYLRSGVEMNLKVAQEGMKLSLVANALMHLREIGQIENSVQTELKIHTAAATDARMAGIPLPVMSSGGSGNQGIVAILVPWEIGMAENISEKRIIESIALSHLLNSYLKCYTGIIAPICGCAIAAGLGAAAAIAYMRSEEGKEIDNCSAAINFVCADIAGLLCDGAKGSCALKVINSSETAVRSANLACQGLRLRNDGIIGTTAEATIKNLGQLCKEGMKETNSIILKIMTERPNEA